MSTDKNSSEKVIAQASRMDQDDMATAMVNKGGGETSSPPPPDIKSSSSSSSMIPQNDINFCLPPAKKQRTCRSIYARVNEVLLYTNRSV